MDKVKSLVRHILTALGSIAVFIGLGDFTDIIAFLAENLDSLFSSISVIVGIIVSLLGFFKDSERHDARDLATSK